MLENYSDQFKDFYFLLKNLGMDYDYYKRMTEYERKFLVKSIKEKNLIEYRKEKIQHIFRKDT